VSLFAGTSLRTAEKRICPLVREPDFQTVLAALLEVWGYTVVSRPDGQDLVLAEEGLALPPGFDATIRLTRSGDPGRDRLALPLEVEALWAALEPFFHKTPRSHIRIALDLPATVVCRGRMEATRISSLSDLGTRFRLSRERVKGEPLELDLVIAGHPLRLAGRVIYVVPRGDLVGSGACEVGMLLAHSRCEIRTQLREFVVRSYLERVNRRLPREVFCGGLENFRLPATVRVALGRTSEGERGD